MAEILLLLASVIFIIPAIIQFRIYLLLKSNSYLRFSLLFVFVALDALISGLELEGYFFQLLIAFSSVTSLVIIGTISLEVINNRFIINRIQLSLFGFIIFIGTAILKYMVNYNFLPQYYSSLRIVYGEILELSVGIIVLIAFRNIKLVKETRRTTIIKRYWMLVGVLLVISALTKIGVETSRFFYSLLQIQMSNNIRVLFIILDQFVVVNVFLISVMSMVFAIFYPETLLLSVVQIDKVTKLYDMLEDEKKTNLFFSEDLVVDYLSSLPDDVKNNP